MPRRLWLALCFLCTCATSIDAQCFRPGTLPIDTNGAPVSPCRPACFGLLLTQVSDPHTEVLDISTGSRVGLAVDREQVHAHGGGIIRVNSTYYWYGTTQKQLPGWISEGINLYSSSDLLSWTFEGAILHSRDILDFPFPPPYRIERPSVADLPTSTKHLVAARHLLNTVDSAFADQGGQGPYAYQTPYPAAGALQQEDVQICPIVSP